MLDLTPWAHDSKAVKNICIEEKCILWSTHNPGLVLPVFRTTRPWSLQINKTWACDSIKNQHLVSSQLQKKHKNSMSSKLEPVIWSHDSGQQIPCFDRCQLTIAWMFNVKDARCKPRLQDLGLTRVRPPCCAMSSLGARACNPCLPWEKSCISMHACDPIFMGLCLAAQKGCRSSAINYPVLRWIMWLNHLRLIRLSVPLQDVLTEINWRWYLATQFVYSWTSYMYLSQDAKSSEMEKSSNINSALDNSSLV